MFSPTRAADAFTAGSASGLRVLAICAAPLVEGAPLDLRREWLCLKDAFERGRVPVSLFRLMPPTREALEDQLREASARHVPPHVLHFAGHGEPRHLWLEDPYGEGVRYGRDELAVLLREARVPVVVLNACHTATRTTVGFAQALTEGEDPPVRVAIGHTHPVPDSAAVAFAGAFYTSLARGECALVAWCAGKQAMGAIDGAAADAVQLFGDDGYVVPMQGGASEARVFDGTTGRVFAPEVPHFFGRVDELKRLGAVLANPNLRALALCGVGGIGKTTMALELAQRHAWRFPGGVVFITITARTLCEAPTALALVTEAAGLLGASAKGVPALRALLGACAAAPTLVVLDNLENLPGEELEKLVRVLEQLPLNGSKVVLTLRPATGGLDEWAWLRVERVTAGLSLRAAAAMVEREARARGIDGLCGTAHGGSWEGPPLWLAHAVSGHPMMIEEAVGTAAMGGLDALRAALPELEAAERSAGAVHRLAVDVMELRMTDLLATCVRTLGADGQAVLGLLPLFLAGSVSAEEGTAAMGALVAGRPLVANEEDAAAWADAGRRWAQGANEAMRAALFGWDGALGLWRFHPMVAKHSGHSAPLGAAFGPVWHAVFGEALRFVAERREDGPAVEGRLDHLFLVFEEAWRRGEQSEGMRNRVAAAVDALGDHLHQRGHWGLMEQWRARLGQRTDESPHQRSARLYKEASLLRGRGQLAEAREQLSEAIRINEALGNQHGRAVALHQLAGIEAAQGNPGEARRLFGECIVVSEALGDRQGRAASFHALALIEADQGNPVEARRLIGECIAIEEEMGDPQGRAASQHALARIEIAQGNPGEARRLLRESIAVDEKFGDLRGRAASLYLLVHIEFAQGNTGEARRLLREYTAVNEELGDRSGQAVSQYALAGIEAEQGNPGEARRLLHECIPAFEALGDRDGRAKALRALAVIEAAHGNPGEARRLLGECIVVTTELGDRRGRASLQHELARVEAEQGNLDEARRLLHDTVMLFAELGDRKGRAASLHELARIETTQKNLGQARLLLGECIAAFEELGDRKSVAASLHALANIEVDDGRLLVAERLYMKSVAIERELGHQHGLAITLVQLGQLIASRGDLAGGAAQIREAITIFRRLGLVVAPVEEILRHIEATEGSARAGELIEALLRRAHDANRYHKHSEVLEVAQQAMGLIVGGALAGHESEARCLIGQALIGLSRPEEARPHLQRSLDLLVDAGWSQEAETVRELLASTERPAPAEALAMVDAELARSTLPAVQRLQLHTARVHALLTLGRFEEAVAAAQVGQRESAAAGESETLGLLERMMAVAVVLAVPLAVVRATPLSKRAADLSGRALAQLATGQTEAAASLLDEADGCLAHVEGEARLGALINLAQGRGALGDRSRAREHIADAERLAVRELPQALSLVLQVREALDAGD